MTLRPVLCPRCGMAVSILTTATGRAVSLALTEPCLCAFGDRTRIGRGDNDEAAEGEALRAVEAKGSERASKLPARRLRDGGAPR